jgi:catechol 2,3-dioxygenase-like lactoylglutathione lyase family enzyme
MVIWSSLSRIILYVHHPPEVSAFYQTHFGFREASVNDPGLIHLVDPNGGTSLSLLKASKGQKSGQSLVKLVFEVEDVEGAKQEFAKSGLHFGATHHGVNYEFANGRDPAQNLIQITTRRLPR